MIVKVNFSLIALYFLMFGSALYINIPGVGKPYFIFTGFGVLFTFFSIIVRKKLSLALPVLFPLVVMIVFLLKMMYSSEPIAHLYVFNIALTFLLYLCLKGTSIECHKRVIKQTMILSLFVFSFEAIYRFFNPVLGSKVVDLGSSPEGSSFYMYKISSLMYTNSNGVGMHLVFLGALLMSIAFAINKRLTVTFDRRDLKFIWFFTLVFFIFTLLTLSRAAILVYIIMLCLYFVYMNNWLKFLVILLTPISIILGAGVVIEVFISDHSFLTKFEIFNNLFVYLEQADILNILFGNSLDEPQSIFNGFVGYYGHTHYFDLIFKGGWVIALLYLLMLMIPIIYSRHISIFFILPFLILGFSNIRVFGHYIFFIMPLYCVLFYDYKKKSV